MHESILGLTCYNAKYNGQFMEFLICNSVNYMFSGIIKLFIKLTRHDLTNYHIHKHNAESILCPSAVTDQSWLNITSFFLQWQFPNLSLSEPPGRFMKLQTTGPTHRVPDSGGGGEVGPDNLHFSQVPRRWCSYWSRDPT